MNRKSGLIGLSGAGIAVLVLALALASPELTAPNDESETDTFLVQAESAEVAARLVAQSRWCDLRQTTPHQRGGRGIDPSQVDALRVNPGIRRVYSNREVQISARKKDATQPGKGKTTDSTSTTDTTTTDDGLDASLTEPVATDETDATLSSSSVQDWKIRDAAAVDYPSHCPGRRRRPARRRHRRPRHNRSDPGYRRLARCRDRPVAFLRHKGFHW